MNSGLTWETTHTSATGATELESAATTITRSAWRLLRRPAMTPHAMMAPSISTAFLLPATVVMKSLSVCRVGLSIQLTLLWLSSAVHNRNGAAPMAMAPYVNVQSRDHRL